VVHPKVRAEPAERPLREETLQTRTAIYALGIAWLLTLTSLAAGQTLKDPALQVREVVAGLSLPTTMAFIGPRDLLVLQKNDGRVRRVLDYWLWPKGKDKG
jgi:hypothetical protein